MSQRPRLITFGISHFCEKSRWALDWHGIGFDEECWAPGLHVYLAKRMGLKSSSVPILLTEAGAIQGSHGILAWTGKNGSGSSLDSTEAQAIEQRADQGIGVYIRLFVYAICLPKYPESVRPALYHDLSLPQRILGRATWPGTRRLMLRGFGIRPDTPGYAKDKFETELDWLDGLLSDGRPSLAGDRFSRADLAVAALLSPLIRPPQMSIYRSLELPPEIENTFSVWMERPSAQWASGIYQTRRDPRASGAASAPQ